MVSNLKCENCAFQNKCVAKNKLRPFFQEARVDLGVHLNFISCDDYQDIDSKDEESTNDDEDECPSDMNY